MLLSIIVPVYNVEKYLRRCVDSLLDQGDFNDYEIILVDDGSMDDGSSICDGYAEKFRNIIVIHKWNGGLSSARNRGIKIIHGKYALFVDSDDYLRTNCLGGLIKTAEDNSADIVCFNYTYITDPYGARVNHEFIEFQGEVISGIEYLKRWSMKKTIPMSVWSKLYKADLLLENSLLFREGFVHEDEEWSPRVLCCAERVVSYPQCIYGYYIREDSISNERRSQQASADLISNCGKLKEFFKGINDIELRHVLENNTITLALSAFYKGKLLDKSESVRYVIDGLYANHANGFKRTIFLWSPKLYFYINVMAKNINKFVGCVNNGKSVVSKVYQYTSQHFRKCLREKTICAQQKQELQNHSFSIISSTCNGGVITSELGEQMRSPTINLWMNAEDYLKLASNLQHYMGLEVVEKQNRFDPYPVGTLGDITLYFMHYHSFEEAKEKWNARKQRINWDNLFVMMAEKDGCTPEMVREFDALPFEHKVIFTINEYPDCKSAIKVTDRAGADDVGIMTDFVGLCGRRYDSCFDYVGWLNGENSTINS